MIVEEIRIITLWQPWASLVALGLKNYETRSWKTDYRGKLAIHAAKRIPKTGEGAAILRAFPALPLPSPHGLAWMTDCPLGVIVAIADLTGCYEMKPGKGATVANYEPPTYKVGKTEIHIDSQTQAERAVGDWTPGRFAWKLENIKPLDEPIPYRGGQGLRKITDYETLLAIAARI